MTGPLALALASALIASAAQAGPADLASARRVIETADAEWLGAMQAKDAARIAAPYADDGVLVLRDGQTVVGRAAVAEFYRKRLADGPRVLSGGIHLDGLTEAAGGLIIEWGHGGATTADAAGKVSKGEGPYMTVWKRDAAGRWTIVRNLVF